MDSNSKSKAKCRAESLTGLRVLMQMPADSGIAHLTFQVVGDYFRALEEKRAKEEELELLEKSIERISFRIAQQIGKSVFRAFALFDLPQMDGTEESKQRMRDRVAEFDNHVSVLHGFWYWNEINQLVKNGPLSAIGEITTEYMMKAHRSVWDLISQCPELRLDPYLIERCQVGFVLLEEPAAA